MKIFELLLKRLKDSAPGPDGLTYAAWVRAGPMARQMLLDAYHHLLAGAKTVAGFNHSYFAFIPKDVGPEEVSVARRPSQLRPLSVSNTDRKIIASCVNYGLSAIARKTCIAAQRGGLSGRQLCDNIYDLETHALLCCRLSSVFPAIVLFDLQTAFPSISWAFLFFILSAMGIDQKVLRLIEQLYDDCMHFVRFRGKVYKAFAITRGVLQGCPLSATIFCLVIDPFLRMSLSRIFRCPGSENSTIVAYMDDVGAVLQRLLVQLPFLLQAFELLGMAAGTSLNVAKCLIIPLWGEPLLQAAQRIRRIFQQFSEVRVAWSGK